MAVCCCSIRAMTASGPALYTDWISARVMAKVKLGTDFRDLTRSPSRAPEVPPSLTPLLRSDLTSYVIITIVGRDAADRLRQPISRRVIRPDGIGPGRVVVALPQARQVVIRERRHRAVGSRVIPDHAT